MDASEFPDEFNLRFRSHVLFVHLKATLDFAGEVATEGPERLSSDELKLFDDLAAELERGWMDAMKLRARAHGHA